jgi:hypothetical protein
MFAAKSREGTETKAKPAARPAAAAPTASQAVNPAWHSLATRVRPKLIVGAQDDPLEREADRVAERVMQMSMGPAPISPPDSPPPPGTPIRRLCSTCQEEVRRKAAGVGSQGGLLDLPASDLTFGGEPLSDSVRRFYEPRLGHDLSAVRVHTGELAGRRNQDLNSHAFTYGNHIWMGRGQSSEPSLLLAHELAHVAQQRGNVSARGPPSAKRQTGSPVRRKCPTCASVRPPAREESPAAPAAGPAPVRRKCVECASGDREHLCPECEAEADKARSSEGVVRRDFFDDAGEFFGDVADAAVSGAEAVGGAVVSGAEAVGEVVVEGAEAVAGFAKEVWELAKAFAGALGGVVSISGTSLVITVPRLPVCVPIDLTIDFPQIPIIDIPLLSGILGLPDVTVIGMVSFGVDLTPEVQLQLGPCYLDGFTIRIDPLGPTFAAGGSITAAAAAALGATVDERIRVAGAFLINAARYPGPIILPAVGIEGGLTAQFRASGAGIGTLTGGFSFSGTTFSAGLDADLVLELAGDIGVGGFLQVDQGGAILCRMNWPLWKWTGNLAGAFHLDAGLTVSPRGAAAGLNASATVITGMPIGLIPSAFDRSLLEDYCPLCQTLTNAGLMPWQRGGSWKGHPKPNWPKGPLFVYPRDPGIPSKAKCRGACGYDCTTCEHEDEHLECVDTGDGRHEWWVYPNYECCCSHRGCRDHDACYDWCAAGGEKGLLGILGPCHRMCDLQCMCAYNLPQCGGWIFGQPPYDRLMWFSDEPFTRKGCEGPCPQKIEREGGGEGWLLCLPIIELFPEKNVVSDPLHEETKKYTIWRKDAWIPYVGLVTLEIYAGGKLDAQLSAGLGPGTMGPICFDVNPHAGTYKARGQLRIPAKFLATLTVTGELGADASWFLVIKVVSAKGELQATGQLGANATAVLSGEAAISCKDGKPTLETDLRLPGKLELLFKLSGGFDIKTIGFTVFSKRWDLFSAKWDKQWDEEALVTHTGREPDLDLTSHTISLTDLLEWLVSDKAEASEPPSQQRQVREDPLTAATARTIPELASQLDQTSHGTGTVTLNSGASNTAGTDMMTRFLTHQHAPGSDSTGRAQKNIYGFRKLPTSRAHGGSGFAATQVYIKGHLLNAGLGGPAEDRNLFPITGQANKDHNVQVEERVKDLVIRGQRLVAMYGVRVTGQDGPHNIDVFGDGTCTYEYYNANFACTYGTYKLFTDNTVELNPTTDRTINSTFDRPGFITNVTSKGCPER